MTFFNWKGLTLKKDCQSQGCGVEGKISDSDSLT